MRPFTSASSAMGAPVSLMRAPARPGPATSAVDEASVVPPSETGLEKNVNEPLSLVTLVAVSSDESVNSAKLWDAGVKFSYADHQFLAQYIPMVSKTFAAKLSTEQLKLMVDLWAANVAGYRKGSADSQAKARTVLEQNGVKFHDPSVEELATTRKAMMADMNTLIKDAKLSTEIVGLVRDAVGSSA
jgi:hypothetical protein